MIHEYSFGIIPFRRIKNVWHVLLIQHGKSGYWGFPKGHPEKKESPKESAARELSEETGLKVLRYLTDKSFEERYTFKLRGKLIDKVVYFFAAEVSEDPLVLQVEEVGGAEWVPLDKAQEKLTYDSNRSILRQVIAEDCL